MHGVTVVNYDREKGVVMLAVNVKPNGSTKPSTSGKTLLVATGAERFGDVRVQINATMENPDGPKA